MLVNPDGLEWKRAKWSKPVQSYLKYSEKEMTKYANLIISDNRGIETYIQNTYPWSRTTFIAYGTDLSKTTLTAEVPLFEIGIRNGKLKKKIII